MKEKKNNDAIVELFRIIAIFMVIGTHLKFDYIENGKVLVGQAFITCLVGDGVAIFWMIMGFFFFKKQDYKQRIRKLFKRIILPLVLGTMLYFYLYEFVCGISTLKDSIIHTNVEYINLFKDGLLKWKNVVSSCGHLWYLYVYCIVVFMAPILEKIKEWVDSINVKYIVYGILILLFVNDVSNNELLSFSHYSINGALGAFIFMILGNSLYENREQLKNDKLVPIFGLITFLLVNIFRTFVLYNNQSSSEPIFWYTSFSAISMISLFALVFGFSNLVNKSNKTIKLINHFGPLVMYVYIIHMMVIGFLMNRGYAGCISNIFEKVKFGSLFYYLSMILIVFLFSLIISEVYLWLKKIIKSASLCFRKKEEL